MIYILMANGDDYHGTYPVRAFSDKEVADKAAEDAEKNQTRCETCDAKHYYTVHSLGLD